MATEYSGGQGQIREEGKFEVHYTANTSIRGRHERTRRFTEYAKAEAFYNKIDDSAALWDVTNYGELCDSKVRVAYYTATIQTRKPPLVTNQVKLKASDEEGVVFTVTHQLKRRGWKVLQESVQEITLTEYDLLPDDTKLANVLARIFPTK